MHGERAWDACRSCTQLIEEVISEKPGVFSIAVSLKEALATVHYDPAATSPAAIAVAIDDVCFAGASSVSRISIVMFAPVQTFKQPEYLGKVLFGLTACTYVVQCEPSARYEMIEAHYYMHKPTTVAFPTQCACTSRRMTCGALCRWGLRRPSRMQ